MATIVELHRDQIRDGDGGTVRTDGDRPGARGRSPATDRELPGVALTTRTGHTLRLRPGTTDDRGAMARLLEEMSEHSRHMRFFQPMPRIRDHHVKLMTDADQVDRVMWMAFDGPRPIAEARYARTPGDPACAEFALSIVDDWHRRGLGRLLVQALAAVAREDGIQRFKVSIHGENRGSAALFRSLGAQLRWSDGANEGSFELPVWQGSEHTVTAMTALRRAASRKTEAGGAQAVSLSPDGGGKPRAA